MANRAIYRSYHIHTRIYIITIITKWHILCEIPCDSVVIGNSPSMLALIGWHPEWLKGIFCGRVLHLSINKISKKKGVGGGFEMCGSGNVTAGISRVVGGKTKKKKKSLLARNGGIASFFYIYKLLRGK